MFGYTLKAALESKRLTRVIVSSDDIGLQSIAENFGIEFLERPQQFSTLTAPLEDALRYTCRTLKEREGFQPEAVVVLLGNVPIRKPGQIDALIERLEALPHATAVCTAQEVRMRPEWAKVLKSVSTAEVSSYLPGFHAYRTQDYPKIYLMDGAITAVRWETLLRTEGNSSLHAWLGEKVHLLIQDHPMYSLEVDYPDQQGLAEFYLLYQRFGENWMKGLLSLGDNPLELNRRGVR